MNLKEINAFALPGGPMFVNRGMIEAASREGEVAGVMAHELSHVLLRHGTANATKAQKFQIGALAGAIAGAIVGGGWGQVISQGSQFGLGTWLMKYSREYEKQADLLGAQIMARAGYDPRDLARMFETIQAQSKGSGGPEWMSSHPNPGNRSAYIAQEAAHADASRRRRTRASSPSVKRELASLPPAKSMADLARGNARRRRRQRARRRSGASATRCPRRRPPIGVCAAASCSRPRSRRTGRPCRRPTRVKFVPQNAYGQLNGETVFTHGVELGVARADLARPGGVHRRAAQALAQGNPEPARRDAAAADAAVAARRHRAPTRESLAGRRQERVGLITTFLADGNLFYLLTIVPDEEVADTSRLQSRRRRASAQRPLKPPTLAGRSHCPPCQPFELPSPALAHPLTDPPAEFERNPCEVKCGQKPRQCTWL